MHRLTTTPSGRLTGSLLALLSTLLLVPMALAAPPAESGAVTRLVEPAFFASYFDEDTGLLALAGPNPEQGCFGEGFDDHSAEITLVQTGAGPIKAHFVHVMPVYVYDMTLEEVCSTIMAGGSVEALYTGSIRTVGNDNDLEVSLTRTNSFGGSSHGTVWDGDGNRCRFSAHVRLQITLDMEFRVLTEGMTIAC